MPIANCQLPIGYLRSDSAAIELFISEQCSNPTSIPIGNWQSKIGND